MPAALSPEDLKRLQTKTEKWFHTLRDHIRTACETLETQLQYSDRKPGTFVPQSWKRDTEDGDKGGGGDIYTLCGRVFEKVAIQTETVFGLLPPQIQATPPGATADPRFWRASIQVVAHFRNPHIPILRLHCALTCTTTHWFDGRIDMAPAFPLPSDAEDFHAALRTACDSHPIADYTALADACDTALYMPHRKEWQGIGGIAFHYLNSGNANEDLGFVRDIGGAFLRVAPHIVQKRMDAPYSREERQVLMLKRGRLVEAALLYDPVIPFSLALGIPPESVMMGMPPEACWE
jgi:coproporphyrinogen III oxidase